MIGNLVTDEKGIPLDNNGNQLAKSKYQPPKALMTLFARCQDDYNIAWQLQHRPFDEFDGMSLLDRARLDQQTFGTFVGMQWASKSKQWRWTGRKSTSRNKLIGILAQVLAAILVPTVFATDDQNNEARDSAKAMRVLLTEHLRKADYDIKFLFMIISALVNPACFVQVEFVEQMTRVKVQLENGETKVENAIDSLMSGLALNIVPIDELMLGDFFTFNMQAQPYLVRVRRISYDTARGLYAGKYFDSVDGKEVDRFDFVTAGKTKVFLATNEGETLYDIDWTEADQNMVQEVTFMYRGEDLQVRWIGGVFMGNYDPDQPDEVYNMNPMQHRRMTMVGDKWGTMPLYNYAKSGFEPLDPSMRFAYYKSAAFKEFWDDATLNMASRLMIDGMHLDVLKPILISGIAKYDSNVIAPGAVASLPKDATVSPYQLGPNLAAAMQVLDRQSKDLEDSTISKVLQGGLTPDQTAEAIRTAVSNAKRMFGVFGVLIADIVTKVGELSIDCVVQNTTVGELREALPGELGLKYQTLLARSKEKNRDVTHKVVMTDRYIGKKMTEAQKREREWELWEEAGGNEKDAMKLSEINPPQFARKYYSCFVDADQIITRSAGADQMAKDRALAVLTSPAVAPWTDQEAVIDDFAIDVYGGNDPDRYKKKGSAQDSMSMMGMGGDPTKPVIPTDVTAPAGRAMAGVQ